MKSLNVKLPGREYPIHIGQGLLANIPQYLHDHQLDRETYIITDTNVNELYGQQITNVFKDTAYNVEILTVPAGESSKSLTVANDLYTALLERRASRKCTIVAFGGGVVGDLAGFVAATYLRGVKFVQVPTTILSQVDSSVGGKVGINHALGKNLIGAFYQPQWVVIDTDVLQTLPKREINAGLAEVVKYGLIRDAEFFTFLQNNLSVLKDLSNQDALQSMLGSCCDIKARVVETDEKEAGLRAILNLGHTAGHALEAVTGYKTFLHGEAVAHGMRAVIQLSVLENLLDPKQADLAIQQVDELNPPAIPENISIDELLTAMQRDKKNSAAGQLWILLTAIGDTAMTRDVSHENVRAALQFMLEKGRSYV